MYQAETTICNASGLHARPASLFCKTAAGFKSEITIKKSSDAQGANAKSVLILMTQGLSCGTKVTLRAEGEDEQDAVNTLVALLESGCGES